MSDESDFTLLVRTAKEHDAAFPHRHKREPEQQYLKRLLTTLSELPEDIYESLRDSAKNWYAQAIDELNHRREIPKPRGFDEGMEAMAGELEQREQKRVDRSEKRTSGRPKPQLSDEEDEAPAPQVEEPEAGEDASEDTGEEGAPDGTTGDEGSSETSTDEEGSPEASANASNGGSRRRRRGTQKNGERRPQQGRKRADFSLRHIRKAVIENPAASIEDLIEIGRKGGVEYSKPSVSLARQTTLSVIELAREAGHWRD